jgi:probable addiction module antidote protein
MNRASRPYKESLLEDLKDPNEAAEYLTAALEDGSPDVFLLALRDVAEAHGMKRLAESAQLNRESMYRMLSDQGNPQLSSLTAVLHQLGLRLAVEVNEPVAT